MITETVYVRTESGFGEAVKAQVFLCKYCCSDEWKCYQIEGHLHFQCANCGTSYCDGTCTREERRAAA